MLELNLNLPWNFSIQSREITGRELKLLAEISEREC